MARPRYLVIDQNYLRADSLAELLKCQPEVRIVLPDLAMLEMTKSGKPELTLKLSLGTLANFSTRVYVSYPTSACLSYELRIKKPIIHRVLDHKATRFLRKVLHTVRTDEPTTEYLSVIEDRDGVVPDLVREYLDHSGNKAGMLELVEATQLEMQQDFVSRVRNGTASAEDIHEFIREKAPQLLLHSLAEYGFSAREAESLVQQNAFVLRYYYLNLWNTLRWQRFDQLSGLAPKRVSNDLLDNQYILSATCLDGILSHESAVNEAYAGLSRLLTRAAVGATDR